MVRHCIVDVRRELFISDSCQGIIGSLDAFRRTEDIDIVLRPEPRINNIIRRLRKPLYDDVLDARESKRFGNFPVGSLDEFKAQSVVCEIGFESLNDPVGKTVVGKKRNG